MEGIWGREGKGRGKVKRQNKSRSCSLDSDGFYCTVLCMDSGQTEQTNRPTNHRVTTRASERAIEPSGKSEGGKRRERDTDGIE